MSDEPEASSYEGQMTVTRVKEEAERVVVFGVKQPRVFSPSAEVEMTDGVMSCCVRRWFDDPPRVGDIIEVSITRRLNGPVAARD